MGFHGSRHHETMESHTNMLRIVKWKEEKVSLGLRWQSWGDEHIPNWHSSALDFCPVYCWNFSFFMYQENIKMQICYIKFTRMPSKCHHLWSIPLQKCHFPPKNVKCVEGSTILLLFTKMKKGTQEVKAETGYTNYLLSESLVEMRDVWTIMGFFFPIASYTHKNVFILYILF